MKIPPAPHRWKVTPKQAIAIQKRLAAQVRTPSLKAPVRWVAGADAAFPKDGKSCVAAVVLWDLEDQVVVEEHVASRKLTFPYIPGLLSFREAPAVIAALRRLSRAPDVVMLDGQGLAHPRRFGLACHIGVICDLPTIGCAKSRLTGSFKEPGVRRGSHTSLVDGDQVIGTVLRTRTGVKPVYVSVGHRIDLRGAAKIVLSSAVRYRLPEPTRLADRLVAAVKRYGV
jgi:deoxyribonuclease V